MDGDEDAGLGRLISARQRVRDFLGESPNFESVAFTDNTVLSWPTYASSNQEVNPALAWVVDELAAFQLAFAVDTLFLRGGVEKGSLAIGPEFVFGSGLNAAYAAESSVAHWPRITISEAVLATFGDAVTEASDDPAVEFGSLLVDEDGQCFVHYLAWSLKSGAPEFMLQRHKEAVVTRLAACKSNPRASDKMRWAASYHDYSAKVLGFPGLEIGLESGHRFTAL